jgi:hypothetical protein
MRKGLLLIVLLFLAGSQGLMGQGIALGLTGGGNMSSLNIENAKYRPGYQAGGYAQLMVTQRLGLHSEILYSAQRAEVMARDVQLDYVLIPVLLKINLNKFINVQLGPQYSMFISSDGALEAVETAAIKHKNLSFALGIGVELPMGFSSNLRFANAVDKSFSQIGEVTSDVVQLSIAIDLINLKNY